MTHLKLDYSALAAFRRCPTHFLYRYVRGLVPTHTSNEALEFGKLFHLGLELLYKKGLPRPTDATQHEIEYLLDHQPPAPDATADPVGAVFHRLTAEGTSILGVLPNQRRSLRHLFTLLLRYIDNYQPDPLQFRTYEQFLEVRITDWLTYCGTIDATLVDGSIFETKTSSFLGTSFLDRMNPNDQGTGYLYLIRNCFAEFNTANRIIFNGASTSGYGLASGEAAWPINKAPATLFSRAETFRTDDQIEDWKARLLHDAIRIRQLLVGGADAVWSANAPDACTMFNTTCPYIDLCRARSANRPMLIQNTMKQEPWKGCVIS